MQEFGKKSDDLTGVFNSCWVFGDKNAAFTNQCGTTDERSMSRDELAQSMPCKEEEDESQITNYIRECERMDVILHRHYGQVRGRTAKWMLAFTKLACMIWGISLLSQRIIGEIVAERRLKTLNCCKYKENLSILTFV